MAPSVGQAQTKPNVVATAPSSTTQPALAVGFVGSTLRARSCPTQACPLDVGLDLSLPGGAHLPEARLAVVRLGADRSAVHVRVPLDGGGAWEAVIAAPLAGQEPVVVFSGKTGLVSGEYGLRTGKVVLITRGANHTYSVLVGDQREDVSLCGRPTILSPQILTADLTLKPVLVQRLGAPSRQAAPRLEAKPVDATQPPLPSGLLRATVASSAVGDPAALTDGDPNTTWAENRRGAGRGEFVIMQASSNVPVTGFEFTFRGDSAPAGGAAPREMWLATDDDVFHVTVPEDAWEHPGQRYAVALPKPVSTSCVAVVAESLNANASGDRLTIAEVAARSTFADMPLDSLIRNLSSGGERAEQAAAALRAAGEPAFQAVLEAFDDLDESSRLLALQVIDVAPCDLRARVYAKALASNVDAQRKHARARVGACGAAAAQALREALAKSPESAAPHLAEELALVAPDLAVRAIVQRFSKSSAPTRRALRIVMGRAASSPESRAALQQLLTSAEIEAPALVELLRALGPHLTESDLGSSASEALARVTRESDSFRNRYLLLEPAAYLAARSRSARAFVDRSLRQDPDWRIRSRAAEVILDDGHPLLEALADDNVRVRAAAIDTLARTQSGSSVEALVARLHRDHWPLVRAAAARALGELATVGPNTAADRALLTAVRDDSSHVRASVLVALGQRRVATATRPVRKRLLDGKEAARVRIAAAKSLGSLCDPAAVDALTRVARRLADPHDSSSARKAAPAAVAALGRLQPPDLRERLAPLLAKDAPPVAREAAQAALEPKSRCGD